MTDKTREARRKQLIAAVSMLSVSLGMSSAAVADQIKGEAVTQKVTPPSGAQVSHKQTTQKASGIQTSDKQSSQKSTILDPSGR